MNKTTLVFKHEFFRTIKKAGFIIMTFIVPVLALLGIGVTELVTSLSTPTVKEAAVIGVVDESGAFDVKSTEGFTMLAPLASRDEATRALVERKIPEYIVIPADYTSTGKIQRYTLQKELGTPPRTAAVIKSFLTVNLLKDKVPPELVTLVVSPLDLEVTRLNESGEVSHEQGNIGNVIFPGLFSLLLGLALMLGANALIGGLGEEKESRLIQVLFSSVSIRQLLIGKVLALGLAGLMQVLVWLLTAPPLLSLASSTFGGLMSNVQLPAGFLVLGIVYFILGYLLFAVLSVGIGAISSNAREAGNLSLFYTLCGFVPLWLSSLLFAFPNSPIWTVLTLFPVTAPVQTMLRMGVTDVPVWEIAAGIGILVLSIILGLFLAIKLFRMYMLMYGKRPGFKEIIKSMKDA